MTAQSWADKDILIVSPAPVFPCDFGNRQRIWRICQRLMDAGARIHFLLYPAEADWRARLPQAAMQAHVDAFHAFHLVPVTRGLHSGAAGTHHLRDEWWDPAIGTYLDWLTRVQRFDAAIVNYTWLSKALTHLPGNCLKILDTHDQFSHRKELFLANGLEPEFFYTQPAEEAAALTRADVVWAIKREEAEFFRTLTDQPVISLPHMGPVTPLDTPPADFLRVGLIGASNNLNAANFERFLDDAVAHVQQHLTQVEIIVAGSVCKVLRPRPEGFIKLIGYVDSLEDFYTSVDVALVPMQFSTGLKIKTAEALGFGKPLLALAHAMEGFHPAHPYHTLTSNAEILQAIEILTRSEHDLLALAQASLTSAAASEAEIQAGLDATLALATPVRVPTFWLTLCAEECRSHPMLADQIIEVAEYLHRQVPALGFLFTGPGLPDDDLCARLAWHGTLVLADTGTLDPSTLPPRMALAPPDLIRAQTKGVWLATRHAAPLFAGMDPGTVMVAGDALAISFAADPAATDADLLAALAALGQGHVYTGAALPAPVAGLLARQGWEPLLLPFLRGGTATTFLTALRLVPERLTAETLPQSLPLDAAQAPGRALLDSVAAATALLLNAAQQGRAMTYRLPPGDPVPVALEYLVRAGSVVALPEGGVLGFEQLDHAYRHNAGWAQFWHYAIALAGPLPPEPEDLPAPEPETAEGEAAAEPRADAEPSPSPSPSPAPRSASPGLGFTRVPADQTLSGQEARFSQLQVYRPTNMALDALDVQFMDANLAGHGFDRLALRFFFQAEKTNIFVRRNDCSADVFREDASIWQEDDWGPFVIYNLGADLHSAYKVGLAGADLDLFAEALNVVARADAVLAPRLSGDVLDRWMQVVAAVKACDLTASAEEPADAAAEPAAD